MSLRVCLLCVCVRTVDEWEVTWRLAVAHKLAWLWCVPSMYCEMPHSSDPTPLLPVQSASLPHATDITTATVATLPIGSSMAQRGFFVFRCQTALYMQSEDSATCEYHVLIAK